MLISVERGALVRTYGAGVPIFCLHGFADNGTMFAPLAETPVCAASMLVAPDMPGFGASLRKPELASLDDYARWLNDLVREVVVFGPVGLVAHSAGSLVAVRAAQLEPDLYVGLLSMEGNLTDADTSGKAAKFSDADDFKTSYLSELWAAGQESEETRRYYAMVCQCDALSMWQFGKIVKEASAGTGAGEALASLPIPTLYYWSRTSTPPKTRDFIESRGLMAANYTGGHMATLDATGATSDAIEAFFGPLFDRQNEPAEWVT